MANLEHLKTLKQGVEVWNRWRRENPGIIPDFSIADLRSADLRDADLRDAILSSTRLHDAILINANLCGAILINADLRGADLRGTGLMGAKLNGVDLRGADLVGAKLNGAKLIEASLRGAKLNGVDLRSADLHDVDLSKASLRSVDLHGFDFGGFDLSEVNLSDANLSNVDLSRSQVLGTDFTRATFTGACLEDWNINSATSFEGVICKYIYLKANQQERRPREGNFKPGEFAALFQQAVDTVDLIFVDGLDWQSFFASLQEIRQQYDGAEINIQAIEKKSGGAFVVRLEASDSLDKADLQRRLNTAYEENQHLRSQLLKTEGKLEGYKEQLDDFQQKVLQGMNSPKYDLRGAQIAGGVADKIQGDQVGGTIDNPAAELSSLPSLTDAASEIQNLLKPLETSNPNATEAEQTAYLNIMIPPTHRERFINALQSAGSDGKGANAITTNTALEDIPYGPLLKALVKSWQSPGSGE
ncbi:MAG: pentapeptide repeat-containing protein [Cyanobacteria bacterium P01_H01_bin.105]